MATLELSDGSTALVDEADLAACLAAGPWHTNRKGTRGRRYVVRNTAHQGRKRLEYLHRFVLGLTFGDGLIVDHVDLDPSNNSRANLRLCTDSENKRNRTVQANNTSGVPGVSLDRRRALWRVRVKLHGKDHFVGYFANWNEAVAAREAAASLLHGEFYRGAP